MCPGRLPLDAPGAGHHRTTLDGEHVRLEVELTESGHPSVAVGQLDAGAVGIFDDEAAFVSVAWIRVVEDDLVAFGRCNHPLLRVDRRRRVSTVVEEADH